MVYPEPLLSDILDRQSDEGLRPMLISDHPDQLYSIEHGYGRATKPEDYLKEFSEFIRANQNTIPALATVLTRPRDLTRKQLRELAMELDRAGFSEVNLKPPGARRPTRRSPRTLSALSAISPPATRWCPTSSA